MKKKINDWLVDLLNIKVTDHVSLSKAKLVIYLPVGYALVSASSIPLMIVYGAWDVLFYTILGMSLLLSTPLILWFTRSTYKTSLFFAIANLVSTTISLVQMGSKIDFLVAPYYIIHIIIIAFLLNKRITIIFAVADVIVVSTVAILRHFGYAHENVFLKEINLDWSIIFNFVLMIAVLLYILNKYMDVRSSMLKDVHLYNEELQLQQKEIERANDRLNQKNKDITDNMVYARRIQNALLDEESYVSKHLPQHFIYYLPKDIVSGDFYWNFHKGDTWYVAVADCTGHGVSGAFLSLLGISYLNEIIKENPEIVPNEVLEMLRTRYINVLGKREELVYSLDGMDIALLKVNLKTLEMEYSGAYNPLYLLRDGKIQETKATKSTIGHSIAMYPFQNHTFQLQQGDTIYLFSDGFADQFGGDEGRKYSYHKLKDFICNLSDLPLDMQKVRFHNEFLDWCGNYDQLDDICVLGIRF